jgi:hypothetical protein
MADHIRNVDRILQAKSVNMRGLLRLATWGCAAAAALMLAVMSATMGSKAVTVASPAPGDLPRPSLQVPTATVQLTTRATEAESATRQLSEAISGLAADRDRLVTRIAKIERNLEEVTGSIKQQQQAAAATPAPVANPAALPAVTPAPAASPPAASSPAAKSQPEVAPAPAATAAPAGAIAAPPSAPFARVASVPEAPEVEPAKSRIVDFAVDIGGATTFEGLRALWSSVRAATADLFDDLHPMVAVRESKSRGLDLRLVVGPIASTEAATRMCATLLATRRYCQMTIFEGQPLPQTAPEPERRPAPAAPVRTTSPAQPSGQTKSVRPATPTTPATPPTPRP